MTPDAPRTARGAFLDAHIDEWLRLSAIPDNRALWNVRLDAKTSLALLDRLREAEAATPADSLDALRTRIIERLHAIVASRYSLGPIFQPDAIDRAQAIKVVETQFARALRTGQRYPRNDEPSQGGSDDAR